MLEHHKFKQPISYHFDVYRPENTGPTPLLICGHGYGQNKEMAMGFGQNIRKDWTTLGLQAPHKHHKFKDGKFVPCFSWLSSFDSQEDITNHHQFVLHCIDIAFENGWTTERKAYLFAFSQTVSLTLRFAAKHPEAVAGIIAVAGATPSNWEASGEPKLPMPVLYICPTEDEAYSQRRMSGFKDMLNYHSNDVTWQPFAGGHRVPSKSYPVIRDWLDTQNGKLS